MSIVTKKGDRGRTSLCGGRRVAKDHILVEALGSLDELCAFVGAAKSAIRSRLIRKQMSLIQEDLLTACAEVATPASCAGRLKRRLDDASIRRLEEMIEALEKRKTFQTGCFFLPGENLVSGLLDVARAVARRTERRLLGLVKKKVVRNRKILVFLNRLSDFLYLLERRFEKRPQRVKCG